jgi:hypothetical protein
MTQIKVRVSDGEVLEVKSHPSLILTAGAGEELKDVDGQAYQGMKFENGAVRNKRPDEIPERQKTERELRLEELKAKPVLTIPEITEILKEYVL